MIDMEKKSYYIGDIYESIEFLLGTGSTDYDLAANQPTFLSKFHQTTVDVGGNPRYPTTVRIRTNNTITVRINTTSGHAITISSTDSPFDILGVQIRNLFISNSSGNTAAVKLFFREAY